MDRLELLVEFILQSDLIEYINDDRATLEAQLRARKSDGHVGAFLYLEARAAQKEKSVMEDDWCRVQGCITAEQGIKRADLEIPSEYVGRYRDVACRVADDARLEPLKIPTAMDALLRRMRRWQKESVCLTELENVMAIADFYFDFERIHPFYDGNGRTGRAMVYYFFRYIGREPFVFTAEEKWFMHFPALKSGNRIALRKYFYDKAGLF